MGQKTNPNIYQLGKTKIWSSKFIEKKNLELSKYSFKNLELNKFILKFFSDNELFVFNCKTFFNEDKLVIFISYFVNFDLIKIKHTENKKVFNSKRILKHKKRKISFVFLKKCRLKKKNYTIFKKKNLYKKKTSKIKKTIFFQPLDSNQTLDSFLKNHFLIQLFKNIYCFFKNKPKIVLNFCQLNHFALQNFSKNQIQFLKKNIGKLRYFNKNTFFKHGLYYILFTLKTENSVEFFIKYLAKELQNHKKQHFFLNFVLKTFEIFNKKEFCNPKNIKIQIKGRFNGSPRSKKRVLQIGNPISVITLNSKIYYNQKTSFSANGTFGIKLWMSDMKN